MHKVLHPLLARTNRHSLVQPPLHEGFLVIEVVIQRTLSFTPALAKIGNPGQRFEIPGTMHLLKQPSASGLACAPDRVVGPAATRSFLATNIPTSMRV